MGCKYLAAFLIVMLIFPLIHAEEDKVDVIIKFKDPAVMKARINSKLDALERMNVKKYEIEKVRKLVMARYEKEFSVKRQFNLTNAMSVSISRTALERIKKDPNVESVFEDMPLHVYLNDATTIIGTPALWNLDFNGINGTGETVCVIDTGIDYTHTAFGACSLVIDLYSGNEENYPLESSHPYTENLTQTYKINQTGFERIAVHFSNISLEPEWDYVKVLDMNNNTIAVYTGFHNNTWSPSAKGDTLYIKLESDESVTDWGFSIDSVINGTAGTSVNYSGCEKIPAGWDLTGLTPGLDDDNPMDNNGHGTHVSGIISSLDQTYRGVSPGARIVPVKAMDASGEGNTTDIMAAIEFCIENKNRFNISVISLSLGEGTYSGYCDSYSGLFSLFSDLVNEAYSQGILVVAAAGNLASSSGIAFPACLENVTSVGATTKSDSIDIAYSNSGDNLDLLAPGTSITSAQMSGGFISDTGTSMAAPFVAGAALLLRNFKRLENGTILSPAQIEYALRQGDSITDPRNLESYQRINLSKALIYIDEIPKLIFLSGDLSCNCSNIFINISTSEQVNATIEFDSINISMNGSINRFYYNISISDGLHNYSVHVKDSTGNIVSSEIYYMNFPNPSAIINLTLDSLSVNLTAEKNSMVQINVTNVLGDRTPQRLFIDSVLIEENSSMISYLYQAASVGIVNITAVYLDSENYSYNSQELFISVVDTTPPLITLNSPQNSSVVQASYQILLNLSTDESADCFFENESMSGLLDHLLEFNHFANETFHFQVNCTDEYNNTAATTYELSINDSLPPATEITVSSTTSEVNFIVSMDEPGNVTVSLGGAAKTSDYSLSHTISFDGLSAGNSYSYSVLYCDRLGNCDDNDGSKSTTSQASAKHGGGGGNIVVASIVADDKVTRIISNPDEGKHEVDFQNNDISINSLVLDLAKSISGIVSVSVKKIMAADKSLDNTYEYYEINKSIPSLDLNSVSIRFSVPDIWMDGKNPEYISLFRYAGKWDKLTTIMLEHKNGLYYYEAQSPGLSLFAISYQEIKEEYAKKEEITKPMPITADAVQEAPKEVATEQPIPSSDKTAGKVLLIMIATLAALSIALTFFIRKFVKY